MTKKILYKKTCPCGNDFLGTGQKAIWCPECQEKGCPAPGKRKDGTCGRPLFAYGVCEGHRRQHDKGQEYTVLRERIPGMTCRVEGCDRPIYSWKPEHMVCSLHYQRLWKNPDLPVETVPKPPKVCPFCGATEYCTHKQLQTRYKASIEWLKETWERQGHKCAACGELLDPTEKRGFQLDHDNNHCDVCNQGKGCGESNRGFLCWRCNKILGATNDDLGVLDHYVETLTAYIAEWKRRKLLPCTGTPEMQVRRRNSQ